MYVIVVSNGFGFRTAGHFYRYISSVLFIETCILEVKRLIIADLFLIIA